MEPRSEGKRPRGYAEEQLNALIETAVDGIMCIDEAGRAELFNPACERIFGYSADEVIGRNIRMLMPPKYAEHHDDYLHSYVNTGVKKIIGIGREVEGRRKNGDVFPMDLSVGEFRHAGVRRFVGIVRDLSARAAAEQRLHELQNQVAHMGRVSAVAEMGSALAHELNQPLTAMTLYLTAAERAIVEDPDKAADLFRRSRTEAARAGEIVRRIRQMVERADHEMGNFNLYEVVSVSIDLCRIADAKRNSAIDVVGLPRDFELFGDATQIQQILVNLIKNALDATEAQEDRRVRITAQLATDRLELDVEDNGPGVAPEIRDRLFSPFTSSKAKGLGIGLSICRNIIEGHGGTLDLVEPPERPAALGGACFRMNIPVETAAND
ncbi:MAG: nitrogen regulation protein NR(II) [Amphiplicatus sp.]